MSLLLLYRPRSSGSPVVPPAEGGDDAYRPGGPITRVKGSKKKVAEVVNLIEVNPSIILPTHTKELDEQLLRLARLNSKLEKLAVILDRKDKSLKIKKLLAEREKIAKRILEMQEEEEFLMYLLMQ